MLDGLDIETLAAAVQAAVPATDWVVRRMASFAGGNTAVAIELVRSLSPDQRAGRAACPNVPAAPSHVAIALAPVLEALSIEARTALAVIAADTTDDVAVVRGALHALGHTGDPLADLERASLVAMAGASLRVRRPMLEVVAYDRLDPSARRSVHRALAASMIAPQHEPGRAWQLAGGSDGPDANVALAMNAVAACFGRAWQPPARGGGVPASGGLRRRARRARAVTRAISRLLDGTRRSGWHAPADDRWHRYRCDGPHGAQCRDAVAGR